MTAGVKRRNVRLAHGWRLACPAPPSPALIRDFLRPAVRAIPSSMARRLGSCQINLAPEVGEGAASQWSATPESLEVRVATEAVEEHDLAMELLFCLGQALWERLSEAESRLYWTLLNGEIRAGVEGEIDEQALDEKRSLLSSRRAARSLRQLERYGRASFAATAAEYIHCLWHEVTVRTGPEFLPAPELRQRLELLARWFPPDRGYRLFASPTVRS